MYDTVRQFAIYPIRTPRLTPVLDQAVAAARATGADVIPGPMSSMLRETETQVFEALCAAFRVAASTGEAVLVATVSNACPVDPDERQTCAATSDRLGDRYDSWFDTPRGSAIFAEELRTVEPLANSMPRPWLDIGVGTGRFATALGVEFGVDPAPAALTTANQLRVPFAGATSVAFPTACQRRSSDMPKRDVAGSHGI